MGSRGVELCIRKGSYRGDVSALCLIPGPAWRGLLLAGTGPHVLLFDVTAKGRKLVQSLRVFDGVRVHGMDSGPLHASAYRKGDSSGKAEEQENGGQSTIVVVHGERRVKFLKLSRCDGEFPELHISDALPRFNHWVADVKLLFCSGREKLGLVAIGLSNNSVSVWDLGTSAFVCWLESSERCLLYSMRLWGDTLEELRVASGTVFNEVLVWEFKDSLGERQNTSAKSSTDFTSEGNSFGQEVQENSSQAKSEQYLSVAEGVVVVDPLLRLRGHEGSIHRIMWSADGASLISSSDDRTARIWCARRGLSNDGEVEINPWAQGVESGPVLRGHGSRLWDCYLGDRLMATASEDCTCRLWTLDGRCLATLKGHKGRGIWRCVYDPHFNVLVTAGADSSIKVHSLDKWIIPERHSEFRRDTISRGLSQSELTDYSLQKFTIIPPWVEVIDKGRPSGFIDSKSEYVRCLVLRDPWSLYVCTNQGAVFHVDIARQAEAQWTLIADALEGPIVCMDVASLQAINGVEYFDSGGAPEDDIVAVGDGGGVVTLSQMQRASRQCHCLWRCSWTAERKRQLLGLHLCRSVKGVHVFTTDPRGTWQLWQVSDFITGPQDANIASKSNTSDTFTGEHHDVDKKHSAQLIALGHGGNARILCIELCLSARMIVCGDKRGDLTVFAIPEDLSLDKMTDTHASNLDPAQRKPAVQLPVLATFKGAHGISPVNSVRMVPSKHNKSMEIVSTGSDTCICTFTLDRQSKAGSQSTSCSIHCTGVRKVAPTLVEKLEYGRASVEFENTDCQIASGFSSDDFILWDATAQSEVMRVKCGGWKRPHSSLVGEIPELQQCFAFVKGHVVHVHRNWVPSEPANEACSSSSPRISGSSNLSNAQLKDQSLRSQFHGKEISSVVFLQEIRSNLLDEERSPSIWMATGSEDETVVVSRYAVGTNEEVEPVCVLGDHVGGSAIRALAVVAEPYLVNKDQLVSTVAESTEYKDILHEQDNAATGKQVLFSAGAKEVLTCWAVDWPSHVDKMASLDLGGSGARKVPPDGDREHSLEPSIRWLCSNSRQRFLAPAPPPLVRASAVEKIDSNGAIPIGRQSSGDDHDDPSKENSEECRHLQGSARPDDDQRYLCLTAFATRCAKTGSMISFVATASSNATLCLYACHVTHRSWVELAVLEYPNALVLSIGFLVVPLMSVAGVPRDSFMVITGAANGDIALWDVTDVILEHSGSGPLEILDEGQLLRPLRGRGSQGGRLRKKEGKPGQERFKSGLHDSKSTESSSAARTSLDSSAMLPFSADGTITIETDDNEGSQGKEESESKSLSGISGTRESSDKQEVNDQDSDKMSLTVLQPCTEIKGVHQSGVNCLSVAKSLRREEVADRRSVYTVISGGDDQDLHLMVFAVEPENNGSLSRKSGQGVQDIREDKSFLTAGKGADLASLSPECRILSRDSMKSAHSSAVKGVWTDGAWAFSVGLDQRLRIWKIDLTCVYTRSEQESFRVTEGEPNFVRAVPPLLEERGTVVVDVPEPASLHATVSPAGQYHIAVVGRGLQMIRFDPNL